MELRRVKKELETSGDVVKRYKEENDMLKAKEKKFDDLTARSFNADRQLQDFERKAIVQKEERTERRSNTKMVIDGGRRGSSGHKKRKVGDNDSYGERRSSVVSKFLHDEDRSVRGGHGHGQSCQSHGHGQSCQSYNYGQNRQSYEHGSAYHDSTQSSSRYASYPDGHVSHRPPRFIGHKKHSINSVQLDMAYSQEDLVVDDTAIVKKRSAEYINPYWSIVIYIAYFY